jgi:hypothetical protein
MLGQMRGGWLVVLAFACDRGAKQPEPLPPGPRDAAIDAVADAPADAPPADAPPLEPSLSCNGKMSVKGWLKVRIDPATLRGEIDRLTAGRALGRHIKVIGRRDGATTTLIFDGYLPGDHVSIRGVAAPRPRGERLVRGTSIVGRLVAVPPAETRLYVEHDIDWVTDADLVVQDGYTVCTPVTR